MGLGWLLCEAGSLDEGIDELQKTLELDPGFIVAHNRLALCYARKGMYDGALAEAEKISSLGSRTMALALQGQIYAMSGKKEKARTVIEELKKQAAEHYVSPGLIAIIYTALGEQDQAFAWLEKSVDERDLMIARLKLDSRFESLRSDPRFAALVKRAQIP